MRQMYPYLNFGGKCREALAFYQGVFAGEIVTLMTGADSGQEVDEAAKNSVLHAEFKADGVHFMATDGRVGQPVNSGDQIHLCLNFSDNQAQAQAFDGLSAGGQILQPLVDAFWGGRFGMLIDRYGVHWMFNSDPAAA